MNNVIYIKATDAPLSRETKLLVRDLDRAIEKVDRVYKKHAEYAWHLGRTILDIHTRRLWELRCDTTGTSLYRDFRSFVRHELKITPAYAYMLIDLAKGYDSPTVVQEIGPTKAIKILSAPPKYRAALVERAKAGITMRRLVEAVRQYRDMTGWHVASPKALAGMKGGAAKARKSQAIRDVEMQRTSELEKALTKIIKSAKRGDLDSVLTIANKAIAMPPLT